MIYIDGFVAPVAAGTTSGDYATFAGKAAAVFKEHGAIRLVDAGMPA